MTPQQSPQVSHKMDVLPSSLLGQQKSQTAHLQAHPLATSSSAILAPSSNTVRTLENPKEALAAKEQESGNRDPAPNAQTGTGNSDPNDSKIAWKIRANKYEKSF